MTAEYGEGEAGDFSPEAVATAGRRSGRSAREIAVDLHGAGRVDSEWTPDGPMRAAVRWLMRGAADGAGRWLPGRR